MQQLLQETVRRRKKKEEVKKPRLRRRPQRTTPVLFADSPEGTLRFGDQSNEELLAALLYDESNEEWKEQENTSIPRAGLADGALENLNFVAFVDYVEKIHAEEERSAAWAS